MQRAGVCLSKAKSKAMQPDPAQFSCLIAIKRKNKVRVGETEHCTYNKSSTSRLQTPVLMTSCILSLVPSDKYDSAQHASVSTSSSFSCNSRASVGNACFVCNSQQKLLEVAPAFQHCGTKRLCIVCQRPSCCTACQRTAVYHSCGLLSQVAVPDLLTSSNSGWGLPRQKLDNVQVAFLSIESLELSLSWARRGCSALCSRTMSRHTGESPAMFPSAQTACKWPQEVVAQ